MVEIVLDSSLPDPPFEQVRSQVARGAASGELPAGTKLPTVRALATELGIAVNTVARAYKELEALGVVETRGRAGTFVSGGGVSSSVRAAASAYVSSVRTLGLSDDEAVEAVRRAMGR